MHTAPMKAIIPHETGPPRVGGLEWAVTTKKRR